MREVIYTYSLNLYIKIREKKIEIVSEKKGVNQ